jgi:hypothetical protein
MRTFSCFTNSQTYTGSTFSEFKIRELTLNKCFRILKSENLVGANVLWFLHPKSSCSILCYWFFVLEYLLNFVGAYLLRVSREY